MIRLYYIDRMGRVLSGMVLNNAPVAIEWQQTWEYKFGRVAWLEYAT